MSCTRLGAAKSSGTGGRAAVAAISRVARRAAARPAPRPSRRLWLTITTQGPCTSQKWHSALNVDMAAAPPLRLKICLAGQRLHLSKSDGTGRSGRRPFSWGEASRIQADAAPTCWLLKWVFFVGEGNLEWKHNLFSFLIIGTFLLGCRV